MHTEYVDYKHGEVELQGYLAYDPTTQEPRPVVMIGHTWCGRDEFVCEKAEALTKLGYVGFAMDVFGKGVIGSGNEENAKLIHPFMEDRQLLRERLLAGFATVSSLPMVDPARMAMIGYCFGGLCALDLARSGADMRGVVSFHGLLNSAEGTEVKPIKAKVLALHGHDDPLVPPEDVLAFEQEMTAAEVDWQLHAFGNTMHAFTNPNANDPDFGAVYNPLAEERSWQMMQTFLKEVFIQ